MDRLTGSPRGAFAAGTLTAAVVAVAVFVLGAPGWILLPISFTGATVYAELSFWVDRRLGRRR
jgi:hypothetical protein